MKKGFFKNIFIYRTFGISDISKMKEIWEQASIKYNGSFAVIYDNSISLQKFEMKIIYKESQILISESDTKPLKFEFEFFSEVNYNLEVLLSDFLSKLCNKIFNKSLKIKHKYQNKYLVKSNNFNKTSEILSAEVFESIYKHKVNSILISYDKKKRIGKLITITNRNTLEEETLSSLIELHFKIIDSII